MNIQEFRRRENEKNKVTHGVTHGVTPKSSTQKGYNKKYKMIDSIEFNELNNKQHLTVDDVLYSKFDKTKKKGKNNVLIKINNKNMNDDELKVNKKNKKILIKWLEQESKKVNKSDY